MCVHICVHICVFVSKESPFSIINAAVIFVQAIASLFCNTEILDIDNSSWKKWNTSLGAKLDRLMSHLSKIHPKICSLSSLSPWRVFSFWLFIKEKYSPCHNSQFSFLLLVTWTQLNLKFYTCFLFFWGFIFATDAIKEKGSKN